MASKTAISNIILILALLTIMTAAIPLVSAAFNDSNFSSSTTYRLEKNETEPAIDCRLVCPNNCNYNETYEANRGESALITTIYNFNYSYPDSFNLFATSHPAFQKCKYQYSLKQDNPFYFSLESYDVINLYFDNKSYSISFYNTSIESTYINVTHIISRKNETSNALFIETKSSVKANLTNDKYDVEFSIMNIYENEKKYRKNRLRDYVINFSITRITPEMPRIEIIKNETPKNITPIMIAPENKTGRLMIAAKSTVERPVSIIVGSVIIGSIVLIGVGLYYGYKKMNW